MSAAAPRAPLQEANILYTEKEVANARALGTADRFEIGIDRLRFGHPLGQGAFGLVYHGQAEAINNLRRSHRSCDKTIKKKYLLQS